MGTTLIAEHSDVEVQLWKLDWMGGWTVGVKALVGVTAAFWAVDHVVTSDRLKVDPVPTCRELDVDFQLCNIEYLLFCHSI